MAGRTWVLRDVVDGVNDSLGASRGGQTSSSIAALEADLAAQEEEVRRKKELLDRMRREDEEGRGKAPAQGYWKKGGRGGRGGN